MSQVYKARRKADSKAGTSARGAQAQGPALSQLRGGAMPTAEQLGHRVDLPGAIQAKMEAAFGADLSGVELYESQTVADAGAQAMTMGNKIGFAPGELDFASSAGQALLGHELSHVVSQARGEVTGNGFLNDHALEARADREGALAAAGEAVYTGPVTPISTTSTALSAAGPMQAKKDKKKAQEHLNYMQSNGRSQEGDAYFAERFGDAQNRGAMTDSHMFRLFLRQSYGKSREEKDDLYDMYVNPARRGEYLDHLRGLTSQTMTMDMDQFNFKDKKSLLKGVDKLNDAATDTLVLSDVLKDNQAELGYSDRFMSESFAARRQYLKASKAEARGLLREMTGEQKKGATARDEFSKIAFGETGQNQGFQNFADRYLSMNREAEKQKIGRSYNEISMAHYQAATPEQREAGKAYIKDSRDLNGMLRGNVEVPEAQRGDLQKRVENLDGMMQSMQSDQKGYRAISDAGLLPLLAQAGMQDVIKPNGTIDHQKLLEQKERLIGLTYQDKGFVSTTAARQFAENWGEGIAGRDLNFFKQRALERHGVSEEERNAEENKDLFELLEGPDREKMTVQKQQQAYGYLADNILKGDERVEASDIGSHLMEIALPKGSKAAYIDSTSTPSGQLDEKTLGFQQLEILLNRGSRFRISDIVPQQDKLGNNLPNQYRIIMEMLQEEEAQGGQGLQPPTSEAASAPQKDVDDMTVGEKKKYMIRRLNGMLS